MNAVSSPSVTARGVTRQSVIVSSPNPDSRSMMSTMLEIWGYEAIEANGGHETVMLARDSHPKAILLESSRVLADDLKLMSELRSDELTDGVPLIVLSGYSLPAYSAAYFRNGATEIMLEPVDPDDLADCLLSSISSSKGQDVE